MGVVEVVFKAPLYRARKKANKHIGWDGVREKREPSPKGPKIEKIQDRPPGLKFSIEIENFNLDPQQTPIICGEF